MKTTVRPKEIHRKWFLIDGKELVTGKIATKVAKLLRGKDKVTFTPDIDMGDHVIVINSESIVLTGNKLAQKKYYTHSGYPGKLKTRTAAKVRESKPEKILVDAVKGMLPRNKLRKTMIKRLHVYKGADHKHEAQQPETITTN